MNYNGDLFKYLESQLKCMHMLLSPLYGGGRTIKFSYCRPIWTANWKRSQQPTNSKILVLSTVCRRCPSQLSNSTPEHYWEAVSRFGATWLRASCTLFLSRIQRVSGSTLQAQETRKLQNFIVAVWLILLHHRKVLKNEDRSS